MKDLSEPLDTQDAREKLAALATDGSDEEVQKISSAIHLGLVAVSMFDSLTEARAQLDTMGIDPPEGSVHCATIVGHKPTGQLYTLHVTAATEEDAEAHQHMLDTAPDLSGAVSHTKH